jgi:hypothetical protein
LLLLIYAALFVARIFSTTHGGLADEEAEVPIVAEWLASVMPFELLPRMQYMRFCGGCTAEWREAASRGFEDGREWVFLPEKR